MDRPLEEFVLSHLSEEEMGRTVSDYWSNGNWKWDEFGELLPHDILEKISSFGLANEEVADNFFWNPNLSGQFSIKSTLEIIIMDDLGTPNPLWGRIWKAKLLERIKHFIWLLAHDCILSNANRVRRRIGNSDKCGVCPTVVEDALHIVRNCKQGKSLWVRIGVPLSEPDFWNQGLQEWICANLSRSPKWAELFSYTVWWLWRWRNTRIFGVREEIPTAKVEFIEARIQEFREAQGWNNLGLPQGVSRTSVGCGNRSVLKWCCPSEDWHKLNTDGAFKPGSSIIGAGGVIRNSSGNMTVCFAARRCGFSAVHAELFAVHRGLLEATKHGITKLVLEVDALEVAKMLGMEGEVGHRWTHIVTECRNLMTRVGWKVVINHIRRTQNAAADACAKKALVMETDDRTWLSTPPFLQNIILKDLDVIIME
ncbi:hypothetical protein V2J09_009985 [Rumex salicifolius]